MRSIRLVPIAAAGALLAASFAPAHAQTAEAEEVAGAATTAGSLTVLGVDAGDLLSLDLLTDTATSNTDAALGVPSALAQIAALVVESPAAGVSQSVPVVAVESTGGAQEQNQELTPIDNPVLSGSILPMALRAIVGDDGADAGLTAGLVDLDVLGGVAGLAGTDLGLGSTAAATQASVVRGVDVDALTVLDLEALLSGLGIPLADLPLGTVLDLVDSLGLLPALGDALAQAGVDLDPTDLSVGAVLGAVDGLTADAAALEDLAEDLSTPEAVCDAAAPAVGLLGELTAQEPTALCEDIPQTAVDAVDQVLALTGDLAALLEAPLALLAGASLLSLEGLQVGVVTTATDDLATSVAQITGTLGGLTVGDLALGSLDVLAAADRVTAVVDSATAAVGDVLGTIDPRLTDLVQIAAMEQSSSVVQDGAAVVSTADLTGLRVDVTPDLDVLLDIIDGLAGVDAISSRLDAIGVEVPAAASGIVDLNGLLAGVPTSGLFDDTGVFALTEGLTVSVAQLSQQARFSPAAAAPTSPDVLPSLPRTGSNDSLILLLGGAAVLAAIVARRASRRIV